MGTVYEAVELSHLGRRVAIKMPHDESDEQTRARFAREGRNASAINHPHVIRVFFSGEWEGSPYLVMELLEGEDLAACLQRTGALAVPSAIDLLLPVLDAVAAAHEQRILHRDLKPSNVFLSVGRAREVHPKVLDFGLSRMVEGDLSATSQFGMVGTPAYVSPEQVQRLPATELSDQYALGAILYECVTGVRAFPPGEVLGLLGAVLTGNFDRPRAVRADIEPGVELAILRAMSVSPESRFGNVREFGAALLPFASINGRARWSREFVVAVREPASATGVRRRGSIRGVPSAPAIPPATTTPSAPSNSSIPLVGLPPPDRRGSPYASPWLVVGGLFVLGLVFVAASPLEGSRARLLRPATGRTVPGAMPMAMSRDASGPPVVAVVPDAGSAATTRAPPRVAEAHAHIVPTPVAPVAHPVVTPVVPRRHHPQPFRPPASQAPTPGNNPRRPAPPPQGPQDPCVAHPELC
jgi:serine/threonine-protein kinase